MDRPGGRRVLKFDGLSGQGLWYRPLGRLLIKSALRDWLYGSYGMIRMLVISLTAFTTKEGNCGMVHEIYDSLFFLSMLLVFP